MAWDSETSGVGMAFHMTSEDPDAWPVFEFIGGKFLETGQVFEA